MKATDINLYNLSEWCEAYECRKLTKAQTTDFFQVLLDIGMVDHLRDEYMHVTDLLVEANKICADLHLRKKGLL